ncbi:hypothetical protein L798_06451 [Zootermopsis nevadensis]|uniref:Uncharacterized protein n=1 Tax=Zootermopsis nevadensis TaxID=136037 RepID=A0A067RHT0_ZOONE|nr:hypothetical protein L798_06451 [Zootermopsis nevadensis]
MLLLPLRELPSSPISRCCKNTSRNKSPQTRQHMEHIQGQDTWGKRVPKPLKRVERRPRRRRKWLTVCFTSRITDNWLVKANLLFVFMCNRRETEWHLTVQVCGTGRVGVPSKTTIVRFTVLTATNNKMAAFWSVEPCTDRRSRGDYCFNAPTSRALASVDHLTQIPVNIILTLRNSSSLCNEVK